MGVEPLIPNDPRIKSEFVEVEGYTYHCLVAEPHGSPKLTLVLLHGWPDLSMGWRYQVPYLASLGIQVIVPDMLGYGRTSAPDEPAEYTMKKMSAHIDGIVKSLAAQQPVVLGGHDWGAALAWRVALYQPQRVRAVFGFCFPYLPQSPACPTLPKLVDHFPNFRYQLSNAAGAVEAAVGGDNNDEALLAAFVRGAFGAQTPEGEPVFDPVQGIHADRVARLGDSPMMGPDMVAHYVREYARHGMRGPMNWYRTHELNNADEIAAFGDDGQKAELHVPAMIVMAQSDGYLPPALADLMVPHCKEGLRSETLPAFHWTLLEQPDESNRLIREFVEGVLGKELTPVI